MHEIIMCSNKECGQRGSCERFTAFYGQWQDVRVFKPDADGNCEHYLYEPGSDYEPARVEW